MIYLTFIYSFIRSFIATIELKNIHSTRASDLRIHGLGYQCLIVQTIWDVVQMNSCLFLIAFRWRIDVDVWQRMLMHVNLQLQRKGDCPQRTVVSIRAWLTHISDPAFKSALHFLSVTLFGEPLYKQRQICFDVVRSGFPNRFVAHLRMADLGYASLHHSVCNRGKLAVTTSACVSQSEAKLCKMVADCSASSWCCRC
jgi:hypothetical protein